MRVGSRLDQLGSDAYPVASLPHRALQHVRDIQLPRDFRDRDILAPEGE